MKNINKLIYQWLSKRFMDGCSNYNSAAVRRGCRSKEQARDKFSEASVPHAKGLIFFNPWRAHKFAKDYGFPLVVKPNVSGFSRGSHFPINDYKSLWKAIFFAKLWWPTTVVEQYLKGQNYRILVANGQIMSVIERYPPHVVGNGIDSIETLIDAENQTRKDMQLLPTIHLIPKNNTTIAYLKKQGLTLQSIPLKDQQIDLFYRIALSPGGVVRTIRQETIPQQNIELFLSVLKLFEANILGIDVIFEKGIEVNFEDQKCIFLEVNSRPYIKMHHYPRFGDKEDLSKHFEALDSLDIAQPDIL